MDSGLATGTLAPPGQLQAVARRRATRMGISGVSMREREPGLCGALPGAGANEVEREYGDLSSKHYPYPNHQGRQSYHPGARSDPSWGPPTPLTILLRVPTSFPFGGGSTEKSGIYTPTRYTLKSAGSLDPFISPLHMKAA